MLKLPILLSSACELTEWRATVLFAAEVGGFPYQTAVFTDADVCLQVSENSKWHRFHLNREAVD